eukprot:TRINITY_DN27221_c0_g1_i1.p1 TRINITY_DN27221_c0_g1~~TRINITY_DN27221_c0_g1_i1.p1  ORF type:complete len:361 (-),score=37.61 TRINITY_DN27221_c0_g1_i1:91-1173(-)
MAARLSVASSGFGADTPESLFSDEGDGEDDVSDLDSEDLGTSEVDPTEDPWSLIRLSMGSLAGTSWRLRQALVWPTEAWKLLPQDTGEAPESWLDRYQKTQTFDAFQSSMPFRPNSIKGVIDVLVVDSLNSMKEKIHVDALVHHLSAFFGFKVNLRASQINVDDWAHPRENPEDFKSVQYGAHFILSRLKAQTDPRSICTIGITAVDLYPPRSYDFVTGISDPTQRVGLYSFYRYGAGRKGDEGLDVKARRTMSLILTICRETMKLCGVCECHMMRCLMNPFPKGPPDVIRQLPLSLCCICLRKLHWLTQMDLLDRYARLPSVLADWFPTETAWLWDRMQQCGLPTYASLRDAQPCWSTA